MITEDLKKKFTSALPKDGRKMKRKTLCSTLEIDTETLEQLIDLLAREGEIIRHRGRGGQISLNMDAQDSLLKVTIKYIIVALFFTLPAYISNFEIFWETLLLIAPFAKWIFGLLIAISAEKTLTILYQKSALRYGFLRSFQSNRESSDAIKMNGNHLQSVFIALFHGRRKYLSNRFGIYKAFLPKWQLISRVLCYVAMAPPVILFFTLGFFLSGHELLFDKQTLLLIDYYMLLSSVMVLLIVSQLSQRSLREATIIIYHPSKDKNLPLISYFFDYAKSNMLSSEEVAKFSPGHDVNQHLYANIRAHRGEHGLYNQRSVISYSTNIPWRNIFTP